MHALGRPLDLSYCYFINLFLLKGEGYLWSVRTLAGCGWREIDVGKYFATVIQYCHALLEATYLHFW